MATSRPFKYNPGGTPISGTLQVGSVSVALGNIDDFGNGGWWNGADEELGYIICLPAPLNNQDTPVPGDDLILSTTYKATDISLTNNNQTATQVFSYQQSILGETLISDGDRVMFSVKFTSTSPGVGVGGRFIGIGLTAMGYSGPFDGYPGGADELSIGLSDDGKLYFSTAVEMTAPQPLSGTSLPTWTNGDVIDVAIDYDLSLLWLRVNGGLWNNYSGSDPSTSSVGVDISSFTSINSSAPGYYPVLCPYIYGTMEVLNIPLYGYPSGYNFLGHTTASVKFYRSSALTDTSFKELVNSRFNQNFLTAQLCKDYLTTNGYWTSWGNLPAGMVLYLDAGLTSSYPGSGATWYDLSGNGNHGTINGGATYSPLQGGVIGFDGVNDYVSFGTVSNIPIGNDNYTISIWFNTSSSDTTGGFFGWGNYGTTNQVNAFRLLANGQGFVNYWWANDQEFFTTVNENTWYNVIAKFDGTNREIWLNGNLVGSVAPSPGHDVPNANNLTIGLTAPFLNEYFPGKIGQVVFYKRGTTDQEIQAIYNSGVDRFV
jgi:hypothetical protein